MKLSEKIACLRRQQNWSQEELAERLDVSRQSVSKWESGASVPELDRIIQLCDLFGLTADELIRDSIDLDAPRPTVPGGPPVVTLQEAYGYAAQRQIAARKIALGVAACVASPAVLVSLSAFSDALIAVVGLPVLFLMVAWGVFQFISTGPVLHPFRHIERRRYVPGPGVIQWTRQAQEQFRPALVRDVAIGVGLCILSPSMPIAFGMIFAQFYFAPGGGAFGAGLLLVMCAAGVYMIVRSCTLQNSYRKLLKGKDQ